MKSFLEIRIFGFQDFGSGHFFGHLFLSIFKKIHGLSCKFSKKGKIVGGDLRFWIFEKK
jgi:hypothetical protein